MHRALYRKWRPQTFDEVCGQEHITSILKYETETRSFSHAYLFCGSRGTGKTTCAKILAKAVNCEHPIHGSPCGTCEACRAIESGAATDVLEMDAASNNGVDNIRDIRDEVIYAPTGLRYRVYIIDEVHMLSVSAFNALLKTLEEPPEHVIFILATTELQKLPATIVSRCQRFDFRRISTDVLMERMRYIAEQEGFSVDPDAARMLAKMAQGGMRDAISLLELCAGTRGTVTSETVALSVGITGRETMLKTVHAVADRNYDLLFQTIDEVVRSSKDIAVFWQDLIALYRDMLVVKVTKQASTYLDLTETEFREISDAASRFSKETMSYHCRLLEEALFSMQKANSVKRIVAEMTLVRMCDEALDATNEALLSRMAVLEEKVAGAAFEKRSADPVPVAPTKASSAVENPRGKEVVPKKTDPIPVAPKTEQSGKAVFHPIRNWMEVVERINRSAPMTASFVKTSRAFLAEDGSVVVRFENEFGKLMMDQPEAKNRLRAALTAVLQREITTVTLEVAKRSGTSSAMDELLNDPEEN